MGATTYRLMHGFAEQMPDGGYPDVGLELVEHRRFEARIQLLGYVPTVLDGPPGDASSG